MGRKLIVAAIIATVLMFVVTPVVEAAGHEPVTGIEQIDEALAAVGLGVLLMILVEVAKRVGWIPDGYAGVIMSIAGVATYLAMLVLSVFQIDLTAPASQMIIEVLTQLANVALILVSGIGSYGLGRKAEIIQPIPGRE